MSEVNTATPPQGDTAPITIQSNPATTGQQPGPIWDKFKTVEDRDKSFGEAFTAVTGQKWKGKLEIGPNGDYADDAAARDAYKKLERAFHATRGKVEPQATKSDANPTPLQIGTPKTQEPDLDSPYDHAKLLEDAGLKLEDVEKEWRKNGKLTDDQYAKIRAQRKNLGRGDIDILARGLAAIRENENSRTIARNAKIVEMLGGEERARAVIEWAKTLPPSEQEQINKHLATDDRYDYGVWRITQAYAKANGQPSNPSRATPYAQTSSIPTTREEFGALNYRMQSGDPDALRLVSSIPNDQWIKLAERFS